jgi:serine/threonine protein kinase
VYLATDRKHQRSVAIKVLGPDLAATLGAERFLREIQTAARLQHPSILALHDYGLAVIEAALGNVNGAIAELELARDERAWAMFAIKHDPAFDRCAPIRDSIAC